jgi:hypothetical protein
MNHNLRNNEVWYKFYWLFTFNSDYFLESGMSLKKIMSNWFQNYLLCETSGRFKHVFFYNNQRVGYYKEFYFLIYFEYSVWVYYMSVCNTQENNISIYNIIYYPADVIKYLPLNQLLGFKYCTSDMWTDLTA